MKILILSNYMICPPISGGAKRFLAPVLNLKADIQYSFIYMSYSSDEISKNKKYLESLENVDFTQGILTSESFQWDWRNIPEGVPPIVWYTMNRNFLTAVETHLKTYNYDIIQVEHSQFAWIVPKIRSLCNNAKIVLDYHNMEWLVYERWIPYAKNPEKIQSLTKEYQTLKEWEENIFQWFDAIFCISPIEQKKIMDLTTTKTFYVPSGAGINDEDYLPPDNIEKEFDLFFIGSMNWYPNAQALEWFIKKVLPKIQLKYPKVKLEIAGSGQPDQEMLKLIKSNRYITFWGTVMDERPFLHQSKVFISPIWIGAGVRLKNPTAWASMLPVVATSLSVEGLEYTADYDVLIGDTPEEFAKKVISLLDSSQYRSEIASNAYCTYKTRYSTERLMNIWESAYRSVIEGE
mgnify:CR=1 FL=1